MRRILAIFSVDPVLPRHYPKGMTNTNLTAALDILAGKTVLAHDRRKADATAIDYTRKTVKGTGTSAWVAIKPAHGLSFTVTEALSKLATKTEWVAGKRRKSSVMPVFLFKK